GVAAAGDLVEIEECRPISRTKTWRVAKVLEKARVI
ncbi:30S ribosomal protein S17, partial [Thauera propionica]